MLNLFFLKVKLKFHAILNPKSCFYISARMLKSTNHGKDLFIEETSPLFAT